MKYFLLLVSLYIALASSILPNTTVTFVKSRSEDDNRNEYFVELLKLILEENKDVYGDYTLNPLVYDIVQSRTITKVIEGNTLNLLWTMTSREREKELLPIRIPLLKGFFGYRIFIIRKEDQPMFSEVKTLEDLKSLTAGQGHDWPDTEIIKMNDLPVVTAPLYESLFSMLKLSRFDYFPRGIHEPWNELKRFAGNQLAVEKTLMFHYPAPMYFFVSKNNTELAERIEDGLNKIIDNGKFNEFFYTYPNVVETFKLSKLSERTILELKNPFLSSNTKNILSIKKYWYTPGEEKEYIK